MTIKIISDDLQMGHEALETYYQLFTIKYIEIIYKFILFIKMVYDFSIWKCCSEVYPSELRSATVNFVKLIYW